MDTVKDFELKRRKYIPVFPKANGKPTVYINGYPYEDGEPMAASGAHGIQINTFYDQLWRYFEINTDIYVGVDSFIYYREGDGENSLPPMFTSSLGSRKYPRGKVFIRGKKVRCLRLFLNFCPTQQRIGTGMKKCDYI